MRSSCNLETGVRVCSGWNQLTIVSSFRGIIGVKHSSCAAKLMSYSNYLIRYCNLLSAVVINHDNKFKEGNLKNKILHTSY